MKFKLGDIILEYNNTVLFIQICLKEFNKDCNKTQHDVKLFVLYTNGIALHNFVYNFINFQNKVEIL